MQYIICVIIGFLIGVAVHDLYVRKAPSFGTLVVTKSEDNTSYHIKIDDLDIIEVVKDVRMTVEVINAVKTYPIVKGEKE